MAFFRVTKCHISREKRKKITKEQEIRGIKYREKKKVKERQEIREGNKSRKEERIRGIKCRGKKERK